MKRSRMAITYRLLKALMLDLIGSSAGIFWRIWQNPRVIIGPFGECSHRSEHCRTDDSGGNVRYGSNVHFAFFNRAVISFTSRFIFSQTLKTPL